MSVELDLFLLVYVPVVPILHTGICDSTSTSNESILRILLTTLSIYVSFASLVKVHKSKPSSIQCHNLPSS